MLPGDVALCLADNLIFPARYQMPTTRLMKFSPTGVSEEVSADGVSRTSHGVRGVSSSHFLKLIEDRGQVGFWTSDVITSVCTISIGYYRLLGIDPSTPFGFHDLLAVLHPDDRPIHSDMCELLRSGHAIDRQFRIIRPDGTLRWVQNKAEVIVGVEGRPARAVGVIFDITEQSAARQSVEEGWFRYRTLIESIAVMEIHVSASGEFVNIEGWQTLTSQTEAEFSGSGWLEAIHPDERPLVWSLFSSQHNKDDFQTVDCRIHCADGFYRSFLLLVTPIWNADGSLREWTGALCAGNGAGYAPSERGDYPPVVLDARYLRAARALLDWTIDDLAARATVSVSSIRRLEAGKSTSVSAHLQQSVLRALSEAGVSFDWVSEEFVMRWRKRR